MLPNQPATPETPAQPTEGQGETPQDFETWLEGQDAKVKELYTTHSEALLNTVKATRKERDDFAKQIKELAKSQQEGTELKTMLDEMSAKLEVAERKTSFIEEAQKPEIQCKNPKAAWLLATADNLFDRKGNPDWNAIKAEAPELFGVKVANASAGNGTEAPPPQSKSMNEFIRQARR